MIQVEVIGFSPESDTKGEKQYDRRVSLGVHTKHFEGNVMKLFQKLQDGLAPV